MEKKQKKLPLLQRIVPLNLAQEKAKFFFDSKYNPQFEYRTEIPEHSLSKFGTLNTDYVEQAIHIVNLVKNKYKSESDFFEQTAGPKVEKADVIPAITEYLTKNKVLDQVKVVTSSKQLARSAITRTSTTFLLSLRLPFDYRQNNFQGFLNHEVGTHVFRWLNELEQPWFEKHKEFTFKDNYIVTEEGLAALHSLIDVPEPYLYMQALGYLLVVWGSQMSFSELNASLKPFIDDPERRWNYCLKVKRGVEDTSSHAVFTKNQIYFLGVLQVLQWLKANNYDPIPLYTGKVSIVDLENARSLSNLKIEDLRLPNFLQNRSKYQEFVENICALNGLVFEA